MKDTIFVAVAAFNEDDLVQTIESCLHNAKFPENVFFGVVLQYPDQPVPDLTSFSNVRFVKMDDPFPYGTSPSRAIAASLRKDEKYFLSIDAHMLFKKHWDSELIGSFKELKSSFEKPVITTYTSFWWRDKKTGAITNQLGGTDLDVNMPVMTLRCKSKEDCKDGVFEIPSPTWSHQVIGEYEEHFLASAHFLFAEMSFLEEVPFDPLLTYYEENTLALRAWTRGYRLFSINKDLLWAREMFAGNDVPNSWRRSSHRKNVENVNYYKKIKEGAHRCRAILTGEILGVYGSPTEDLRVAYEKASGINYTDLYKEVTI